MDQLRRLREEQGLSQARLAAKAGLDPTTVNQVETGVRTPSVRTLTKLAGALETEVADLLKEPALPKVEALSSPIAKALLRERGWELHEMSDKAWGRYHRALDLMDIPGRMRQLSEERNEYKALKNSELYENYDFTPEQRKELEREMRRRFHRRLVDLLDWGARLYKEAMEELEDGEVLAGREREHLAVVQEYQKALTEAV